MKRGLQKILLCCIVLTCVASGYPFQMLQARLPKSKDPIVLRTDFTNDPAWKLVCEKIQEPNKDFGFKAYVTFLNDTLFESYPIEQLMTDTVSEYGHSFVFIVDSTTISNSEMPVLCVGLQEDKGKSFRVIPSEMWTIENNLSISNVDFEDFLNAVDADGIFRGR